MRIYAAVVLCLAGLVLATEDNSKRKSRQILHPIVPLIGNHPPSVLHYIHQPLIPPPVADHFIQPTIVQGPTVVHPASVAVPPHPLPLSLHHPSLDLLHSRGPQVFRSNPPQPLPIHSLDHYRLGHQYSQGASQSGPSFRNVQNVQPSSTPGYETTEQTSQEDQPLPSRPARPQSPSFRVDSSFQSLITPTQDQNEEMQFNAGSPLNQNFRSSTSAASSRPNFRFMGTQSSDMGQPSSQSQATSGFRPSPRLYGPSPVIAHYSQLSGADGNRQYTSNQNQPSGNSQQQENFGFFPLAQRPQQPTANQPSVAGQQRQGLPSFPLTQRSQQQNPNQNQALGAGQQPSSGYNQPQQTSSFPPTQGSLQTEYNTPILSQTGQINNDGSYGYGFHSSNGIQRSETGSMRPGQYRYVEGSYSYTAPDGTPIAAQYYADETGFHIQGDHIPSVPASFQRN